MSAFIIGEIDSSWKPLLFTKTNNVSLLDELCDLMIGSSDDAVFAYEPLEEEPNQSLKFITEKEIQEFIDYRLSDTYTYTYDY